LAIFQVKFAAAGSPEKYPAGRLGDVLRTDSTAQAARQVLLRQSFECVAELPAKLTRSSLIAGPESLNHLFPVVAGIHDLPHIGYPQAITPPDGKQAPEWPRKNCQENWP